MPGTQNSKSTLSFLDGLGSDDRGEKVKLNHTASALVELADFLITTARENMDRKGNTATGFTSTSMKAGPIQTNTSKLQVDVEIASTYKFLDQGVKGTEGGRGKYQFKTKYPGKKMALALLRWVKVRRVATKYKAISANEKKNQRIKKLSKKADSQKSLAYAIATNIKKKGIKPTMFFSDAVKETIKHQKKVLADSVKLDIIEMLS